MENLYIGNLKSKARFYCNAKTGELRIKGSMVFTNARETYQPINEWIKEYAKQPCQETVCNVHVTYLGTSSTKWFFEIFTHLQEFLLTRGHSVKVVWHYEAHDEDMFEQGEDYRDLLILPFELVENTQ